MRDASLAEAIDPVMVEFLTWVAERPRTYAEAMEVWRSNCPRHPVWEDALTDGLVQVARADVTLTPRGRAVLARTKEGAR